MDHREMLRAAIAEAVDASANSAKLEQVFPQIPAPGQGAQQTIVNHYHAAPAPRTGPGDVLKWVAVCGMLAGLFTALAFAAVALAIMATSAAIAALVLRKIWKDYLGEKSGE